MCTATGAVAIAKHVTAIAFFAIRLANASGNVSTIDPLSADDIVFPHPFMIRSEQRLDDIRRDCRRLVRNRSLAAAGAAVVPIPGADVVAEIGLLSTMLPAISRAFELDHDSIEKLDPDIAQKVFILAASLGNNVIGRLVTRKIAVGLLRRVGIRVVSASVAKYVPVIGSAIAASIGFGAMKLAGDAHVEDCYRTAKALLARDATGELH